MKMKSYGLLVFLAFVLIGLTTAVKAQPYYDAYFTSIEASDGLGSISIYSGTPKIYWGQRLWVNMTYYNRNCGLFGGNLFTEVYRNGILVKTFGETYVLKGTYFGNQYDTYGTGDNLVTYKVRLLRDDSGSHYLEDEATFSVKVVNLYVTAWLPSSLAVEKGKATASAWSVTLSNGGNDMMYGASISVVDSGGLQITPSSTSLGNIASGGTQSTSFSVMVPSTLSTGYKTVSFQASYSDFEGSSHVESKTGYVTVNKLGTSVAVALTPSSVKKDGLMTITARLLDGNGNPVASQSIAFSIGTTSLGSANTDSSGNTIKPYTASVDAGTYVVSASYAGNADYGSSIGTSNLIVNLGGGGDNTGGEENTGSGANTLYVVGLVVVVVLGFSGYLVIRRMRRKTTTQK